jgi:hypothetical protein
MISATKPILACKQRLKQFVEQTRNFKLNSIVIKDTNL